MPSLRSRARSLAATRDLVALRRPMLLDQLLRGIVLPVPDLSWVTDGINCSLSELSCSSVRLHGLGVTDLAPGTLLMAHGLSATCDGRWSYNLAAWPHVPAGSGAVTAIGGATRLELALTPTPAVSTPLLCSNCTCDARVESVQFTGGLSAALVNHFEDTLRTHMQSLLDEHACAELSTRFSTSETAAFASPHKLLGTSRMSTRGVARSRLLLGVLALALALSAAAAAAACTQAGLDSLRQWRRQRAARTLPAAASEPLLPNSAPLPRRSGSGSGGAAELRQACPDSGDSGDSGGFVRRNGGSAVGGAAGDGGAAAGAEVARRGAEPPREWGELGGVWACVCGALGMQLLLAVQLLPAASPPWLPAAMRGAPDAPHLLLLLLWAEAREALPPGLPSSIPGAQPSEPIATAGPPVAALVPPLPPWDAIPAPLLVLLALLGLAALWPAFAAAALCAATPLRAPRAATPHRPPSGPRAATAASRLGRCGRALQAAHRTAAAAALWLAEASGRWSLAPAVLGLLVCAAAQTAVPLPDDNEAVANDVLAAAAWDGTALAHRSASSPGHATAAAASSRTRATARIELRLGCGVLLHALAAAAALLAVQHARAAARARRPPPLAVTAPSATSPSAAAAAATARGGARARARWYARLRAALHAASVLVACVALPQPLVELQTRVGAAGRLIALTPPRRLSLLGLLLSAAGARTHARVHVCMCMHFSCTAACARARALLMHCSRPQARCAPPVP